MNKCIDTEIQEMLPDLLHGSLNENARRQVEAHVASCESCQGDLDVIRTVKSAAVFAPAIDVDGVVRQIPPYRMIAPGLEQPTRTRVVPWLVAAGLLLAFVGGGSVVMSKYGTRTPAPAVADRGSAVLPQSYATAPRATDTGSPAPVREVIAREHPQALALAADLANLSDGNLVRLMNEMDQFDALPSPEPEPVIAVDSGDSL